MAFPSMVDPKTGLLDPAYAKIDPAGLAYELTMQQFGDWQSFFQPIELQAMQQLSFNNPNVLPKAIGEAKGAAENAYDTMGGTLERTNRSLGIVPTEGQATATKRMLSLDKALSVASAANTARANVRSQDEQILYGTAPNPNMAKAGVI